MLLRLKYLNSISAWSILAGCLLLGVSGGPFAQAQTTDLEFRESFSFEDDPSSDFETSSETDAEPYEELIEEGVQRPDVRPPVGTVQQQLTSSGRNGRATRFSERVEAASRSSRPVGGGGLADEGIFDGETVQDRPTGIQLGSLRLTPSLDAGTGWTDNAEGANGGTPDGFYEVDAAVGLTSDWERHELGAELRGSIRAFFSEPDNNQPVITARSTLRLDLGDLTTADVEGVYSFSREERSSAENEATSGRTDSVQEIGGRASLNRRVSVIQLRGGIGINRTVYGGQETSSQPRDNTVLDATFRTSFDNGAMFEPYLEGGLLVRTYDEDCDSDPACSDRNSRGYLAKVGLNVDRGPKLSGSLGVGWRAEYLEDDRLDALQGLIFDGSFVWSPTRRDTVTVSGATSFAGTNIDNASGSILYAGDVRYAHQFTQDLVGDVQLAYTYRTYQGVDIVEQEGTGSVGLVWAFAKDAALLSKYTFRAFDSSSENSSYTSSLIEAGLRIRR